jgi:hypothetical protein
MCGFGGAMHRTLALIYFVSALEFICRDSIYSYPGFSNFKCDRTGLYSLQLLNFDFDPNPALHYVADLHSASHIKR